MFLFYSWFPGRYFCPNTGGVGVIPQSSLLCVEKCCSRNGDRITRHALISSTVFSLPVCKEQGLCCHGPGWEDGGSVPDLEEGACLSRATPREMSEVDRSLPLLQTNCHQTQGDLLTLWSYSSFVQNSSEMRAGVEEFAQNSIPHCLGTAFILRTHQCKHNQFIGKETEVQRSKLAQFETIAELKLGRRFGPVIKRFCKEEKLIWKTKDFRNYVYFN